MSFLSKLFGGKPPSSGIDLSDLTDLKRSCWLPVVMTQGGKIASSKFSGIPYLLPHESWPTCGNCYEPMQLFVQLNSDELPEKCGKPWDEGLLQFFYCTNDEKRCEAECAARAPNSRSSLLRVVDIGTNPSKYRESPVKDAFRTKFIADWEVTDDFPNWEEMGEYKKLSEAQLEELGEVYPRGGEKLLGWPVWVQSIEYPDCPKCTSRMQLVFQIDSNRNLPYSFGDAGVGHITQCPTHQTELAFGWACY